MFPECIGLLFRWSCVFPFFVMLVTMPTTMCSGNAIQHIEPKVRTAATRHWYFALTSTTACAILYSIPTNNMWLYNVIWFFRIYIYIFFLNNKRWNTFCGSCWTVHKCSSSRVCLRCVRYYMCVLYICNV